MSVHLLACTSALAHYNMGISSVSNLSSNYEDIRCLSNWNCTRPRVSGRENEVGFETLNDSFDFCNAKHLFVVSLLVLILNQDQVNKVYRSFQSLARVNLQGHVFLKRINHWLLVLFFRMLIFLNMMNSQSDKAGISDILEIFSVLNHGEQHFKKIFVWILPL